MRILASFFITFLFYHTKVFFSSIFHKIRSRDHLPAPVTPCHFRLLLSAKSAVKSQKIVIVNDILCHSCTLSSAYKEQAAAPVRTTHNKHTNRKERNSK